MIALELHRRDVIKSITLAGVSALLISNSSTTASEAEDEWEKIGAAFVRQEPLINLNNAAVSPPTLATEAAMIDAYRFANKNPDVNMWRTIDSSLIDIKRKLAGIADCEPSEIALNRNATESLCTAIFGIPLPKEAEVVISDWDFPSMRKAWEQRARREGVKVRTAKFDLLDSDEDIVEAYVREFGPRTKAILLTHMIHWNGRVLPVARLCEIARQNGILSIVDAAQSFAYIPLSFRQMNCDYLGASLHKWLCAPYGNGMLIVRAARIDETWPLLAPFDLEPLAIEKFEHFNLGTYYSPAQRAVESAIDFHNTLGVSRIHARLAKLTRYWVSQASDINGFNLHTPLDHPDTGGLALFSIEGVRPEHIEKRLLEDFKIRVRYRRNMNLEGVRVSPQIYTMTSDLDHFVTALRTIAREG